MAEYLDFGALVKNSLAVAADDSNGFRIDFGAFAAGFEGGGVEFRE